MTRLLLITRGSRISLNLLMPTSVDQPFSIVQAFKKNDSRAPELLEKKFGQALRTLIRRRCADNLKECFVNTISETIAAVQAGTVVDDSQLPAFIHRTFKRVSSEYPKTMLVSYVGSKPGAVLEAVVDQLRKRLTFFTPIQREALYRYVKGQSPTQICLDLRLDPDHFYLIKRHAMFAAKLSVIESNGPIRQSAILEEKATFISAAV